MRAFLAICLDEKLKKELACVQSALKKKIGGVKWVEPDLLHVTLKFLGEIKGEDIAAMEEPLADLGNRIAPFKISFKGLGAFPSPNRLRVIWIGIQDGVDELRYLSLEIERLALKINITDNRESKKYLPHLTLGRRKKSHRQDDELSIFQEEISCRTVLVVDRFFLMQSTLYPSGPVYNPLKEFLLKG